MSETQPDLREAPDTREMERVCAHWADSFSARHNRGPMAYEAARGGYRLGYAAALAQVSALQAEVERLQKGLNLAADEATSHRNAAVAALRERDEALKAAAILLPFVDMAAGEGLEWSEQEDGSPRMDAANLCAQAAEALGFELGDERYAALLKQGQDAIRSARSAVTETKEGENVG